MTRDEYVRKATERLADLRRPTVAGDIDIPDEIVTAAAEAIEDEAIRHLGRDLGTIHRDDIVRAGLAAALPLLRAQWEADLVAEAARVAHDQPGAFTAAYLGEWLARQPITLGKPTTVATPSTVILTEDFHEPDEPVADVQAAFDAAEKGVTRRPPGWCRWHQMADCHGDTDECRQARTEQDGGGDD